MSLILAFSAGLAVTGCYTHQCDPSTVTYRGGRMVDDDTYETNGLDEDWVPYPPNVTLIVDYAKTVGANRVPVSIEPYIGISSTPNESNDAGVNFTNAAGAVVEFTSLNGAGFRAVNTTCANYFARIVVRFAAVSLADADIGASVGPPPSSGDDASPDSTSK